MDLSNWIALGALLVAAFGLIPLFYQTFGKTNSKKRVKKEPSTVKLSNEKVQVLEKENTKEPLPFMLRILMLVIFAFGSFLIEIIIFSIVANFSDVEVNLKTMSLIWKLIFYSLFLIPGVFLFLALLTLSANMDD